MSFLFKIITIGRLNTTTKLTKGLEFILIRNNKSNVFNSLNKRFQSAVSSSSASSEESVANKLNKKLIENQSANLLVYSVKPSGSLLLNSVGIFVCVLLWGVGYNTFLLFDSVRFKSRKLEEDGIFMNKIIQMIASERFKYSLCSVCGLLGKC